jgi:hypothetical protein
MSDSNSAIALAILRTDLDICSISQARAFLSTSFPKNATLRLIAWLFALKLVPDRCDIASALIKLVQLYHQPPTHPPSADSSSMIDLDVPRIAGWFSSLATSVGLPDSYLPDLADLARRILLMLATDPSFVYYQGYDRYVIVSCLACLQFTASHQLAVSIGEALAFSISKAVIKAANVPQYVHPDARSIFEPLDRRARPIRPDIYADLDPHGLSAVYYAHRWKLLWFADEHEAPGILLIWDNILAHLDTLDAYLDELCLAHLRQIVLPPGSGALEVVQRFRDWKVERAIEDAEGREVLPRKDDHRWGILADLTWKQYMYFVLTVLLFAVLFVWLYQR